MSEHRGKTSRPWEPQRYRQQAHSPATKLPEGALGFFLLAVVPQWDVRRFYAPYAKATRGGPPFDPAMMVGLVLYASSVGGFSNRKIALACERHLAFRAIVGEDRPDLRTISDVRTQHVAVCKEGVSRWDVWRAKRGGCSGATCRRMGRNAKALRRVTRRCVMGRGQRPWSVCARRVRPW
jgi:transposase